MADQYDQVFVVHEVDFGEYSFGDVHEYVLVGRREVRVTLSVELELTGAISTPAHLSELAASALSAECLEAQK